MRKVRFALVLGILLIGGCDRHAPDRRGQGIDADNPLEISARERGVVSSEAATPVGVFERPHDLGRDAMCVVPAGAGQWRFAVTAAFGTTLWVKVTAGGCALPVRKAATRWCAKWRTSCACPDACRQNAPNSAPPAPRCRACGCRAPAGRPTMRGACRSAIDRAIYSNLAGFDRRRNRPICRS